MSAVIEVDALERVFGSNRAVDGMTFHVEQGEVFGLLGPNGAGKTMTVRLVDAAPIYWSVKKFNRSSLIAKL